MKDTRDAAVDILRAAATIIMILTHALVPYLSDPWTHELWDLIHFAVPTFVWCSGYIFFKQLASGKQIRPRSYITKRVLRLMLPYYAYAVADIAIMLIFGHQSPTLEYIASALTATGAIDISWLVLLFLSIAAASPVIATLSRRQTRWLYATALASSAILLVYTPPISYKWYMWLPWLVPFLYGQVVFDNGSNPRAVAKAGIWWILTACIAFGIRAAVHQPTAFFDNKYPPTLLYLAYGCALISIAFVGLSYTQDHISARYGRWVNLFSASSYSLFFIHYLLIRLTVLLGWPARLPWPVFFMVILGISIIIQTSILKGASRLATSQKST